MPVVRVTGRQVGTTALLGVRRTAAPTALAEGAGVEQARQERAAALARIGGTVAETGLRIFAREQAFRRREEDEARQRADQLAIIAYDNQLAGWVRDRVHDPQKGALTIKGKDALALPEQLDAEFSTFAGEQALVAGTPEQRVAFARVRTQRAQALALDMRRHVDREIQTYTANELQSRVKNALELVIAHADDPKAAHRELVPGEQAIVALADFAGLGPEQRQQQARAFRSETVDGIIRRLVAEGKPAAARAYFAEMRDVLSSDRVDEVTNLIKAGTVKQESQQQADRIIAAGGTLSEWREKAKAIPDADVRDQAVQLVEHEFSIRDRVQREEHETRLRGAFDVLDAGRGVRGITADVWGSLDGNEREALHTYARMKAEGTPIQTDWRTYYGLFQQAGDDPEAFSKVNLYSKRHLLDDVEFKQLAGLQLDIKAGNRRKADDVLAGFRTRQEILDQTLIQYGINPRPKPNTDEARAIAQLNRMVDLRVDAAQAEGRKVTNVEIQGVLDEILGTQVTVPGSFWTIWPGGRPWSEWWTGRGKRLVDVTAEDIPPAVRQQVEQALRGKNRPVTDQTVLDLYLETLHRTQGR